MYSCDFTCSDIGYVWNHSGSACVECQKTATADRLYTDLGTAILPTFDSFGKVLRTWDMNGTVGVKGNSDGDAALVFDGHFAVKFDYNEKAKLITNVEFSVDKDRKFYSKCEVYGVEAYVEREHVGTLYTVKDRDEKLYTIFYSESCDYLLINTGIDLSESEIALYLKKVEN